MRYIRKQRVNANLLWGLTTPWQRTVCRSQARLLIQDKLESEFAALKLRAVRRLDEAAAWRSSESDDPLQSSMIKHVKSHPAPQDIKFIKRYIAVCTPDALKFKESKRRVVQRAFAPKDLAEKDRFTENKAARILEERRLRAAQKDMRKAARNDPQERQGGGIFDRRNARPSPRSRQS